MLQLKLRIWKSIVCVDSSFNRWFSHPHFFSLQHSNLFIIFIFVWFIKLCETRREKKKYRQMSLPTWEENKTKEGYCLYTDPMSLVVSFFKVKSISCDCIAFSVNYEDAFCFDFAGHVSSYISSFFTRGPNAFVNRPKCILWICVGLSLESRIIWA